MKLYDKTAKEYDLRQGNPSTAHLRKWEEHAIRRFAKGHVLDIGCGTGYHLNFLKSLGKSGVGIDVSKEMLLSAGAEKLIRADARSLPFPESSFDTVICMFSTLNLLDEQAVKEMARVAKPGGKLILSASSIWDRKCPSFLGKLRTRNTEEHVKRKTIHISKNILRLRLFSKDDLVQLLEKNGFRLRKFYGLFLFQRPYWGRFEKFSFAQRIKLWMDNLQMYGSLGAIYLCVFEKT